MLKVPTHEHFAAECNNAGEPFLRAMNFKLWRISRIEEKIGPTS